MPTQPSRRAQPISSSIIASPTPTPRAPARRRRRSTTASRPPSASASRWTTAVADDGVGRWCPAARRAGRRPPTSARRQRRSSASSGSWRAVAPLPEARRAPLRQLGDGRARRGRRRGEVGLGGEPGAPPPVRRTAAGRSGEDRLAAPVVGLVGAHGLELVGRQGQQAGDHLGGGEAVVVGDGEVGRRRHRTGRRRHLDGRRSDRVAGGGRGWASPAA